MPHHQDRTQPVVVPRSQFMLKPWGMGSGKLLSCFRHYSQLDLFSFPRVTSLLVMLSNFTTSLLSLSLSLYIYILRELGNDRTMCSTHAHTIPILKIEMMQDFKFDTTPDTADQSPCSGITGLSFMNTELTLALPGDVNCCPKRAYSVTVDFTLRRCSGESNARPEQVDWPGNEISGSGKAPAPK